MDATSASSTVHFYDTDRHLILCGLRGFPDRSTKHERSVTCPTCLERLALRRSSPLGPAAVDAGAA
jgi:hypothetical protein